MLIKHSDRTVRKPCRVCGSTALYWAHDTDRPTGKVCDKGHPDGRFVLMNRDGTAHSHSKADGTESKAPQRVPSGRTGPAEGKCPDCGWRRDSPGWEWDHHDHCPTMARYWEDGDESLTDPEPEPKAQPKAQTEDAEDATIKALRDLLAPKVSREDIARMVKEVIADTAMPVITLVRDTSDGETRELEGAQHNALPKVLAALTMQKHVMMVGPAGTGKSYIAQQCAQALGCEFGEISLSPQTPATALLGYKDAHGNYHGTLYRERYEHGGLFHFDELDNAHPSILATLNASLSNGHMAFADGMVTRNPSFRCVASANTYGLGPDRAYVGRSPIDKATLNRFVKVPVGYDNALEDGLAKATGYADWHKVVAVVRRLRERADKERMTVVLSPRNTVAICDLLQTDVWSWEDCVDSCLREGLSDQDWAKLTQGVSVKL